MEIYKYGLDAWTSEVGVVRLLSLGCVVFPDLRKDWITWKTSEKEHLWACLAQWIKFLGTAHKGLPESDRSHSQAAFMLVGCGSCSGLVFCNGPLLEAPRLDSLGYPGGGGQVIFRATCFFAILFYRNCDSFSLPENTRPTSPRQVLWPCSVWAIILQINVFLCHSRHRLCLSAPKFTHLFK